MTEDKRTQDSPTSEGELTQGSAMSKNGLTQGSPVTEGRLAQGSAMSDGELAQGFPVTGGRLAQGSPRSGNPYNSTYSPGLTVSAASTPLPLTWTQREPPLAPAAVAGKEELKEATVRRLRNGAELKVATSAEWTLVYGDDLPWADGVTYLGWDDGLLVPATLQPSTPAGLLKHSLPKDTLAVLPTAVLTGAKPARTADPDVLG